ncbi:MAG: hypothetical protein CSA58_06605 [Micrococcales bacterium]|nr:MAG: hypothetical protein CSB46_06100 [Micrococcales bacterium]PIE27019.1 MAG: hypothetical protein CSA58_06605 [Micrococcales bacterium]
MVRYLRIVISALALGATVAFLVALLRPKRSVDAVAAGPCTEPIRPDAAVNAQPAGQPSGTT